MTLYMLCSNLSVCVLRIVFFFFFQAEDGIRDVAVTGVQTCALPICLAVLPNWNASAANGRDCSSLRKGCLIVSPLLMSGRVSRERKSTFLLACFSIAGLAVSYEPESAC